MRLTTIISRLSRFFRNTPLAWSIRVTRVAANDPAHRIVQRPVHNNFDVVDTPTPPKPVQRQITG